MKKGEVYQAVVEELDFPNKGILHIDGEKVVVKNALPGQKIELLINKKRNGKCEGMLMEVLEKAPSETEAHLCPHFGICGGCMFQSIPYEAQLQMKDAQVRELMDRVCEDYV
ncbi:MAG: 23S rRNA (uracil-5-)-methyltransferase RumA, partial [Hungatella sp.]